MVKLRKKYAIVTSILIVSMSSFSYAHGGRTDSSGGHNDNKNKSGLGGYHYHCGGNPPHLHTNGCPYGSNSESGSNGGGTSTKPSEPSPETKKNNANKDGYKTGYEHGYNNATKDTSSYTGEFEDEYASGYDDGYNEGIKKLEEEVSIAKQKGYDLGIVDSELDNTYTHETLVAAYTEGHSNGINEYKEKKKEEYTVQGKDDSMQDKPMMEFEENIPEEFKEVYIKAYNDTQTELKNKYQTLGFKQAITKKEFKELSEDNDKYKKWAKSGYEDGVAKLKEGVESAYNAGYNGEELIISDNMKEATKTLEESYNKGLDEKKKKNSAVGIAGIGGIGAVGGLVYYKKRNKIKKDGPEE